MKEYVMNLSPRPFERMAGGWKTIEMRLYDDRRKQLQIGDEIIFIHNENGSKIRAKIKDLQRFLDFYALYDYYPKTMLGYYKDEVADPKDMYEYYPEFCIDKYGVLAIEIEVLGDVF